MENYDNQRENPQSPCYGCKNYHWGCPADDWDSKGRPMKNNEYFAMFCHSGLEELIVEEINNGSGK